MPIGRAGLRELPERGRIGAVDPGDVRIGVAITDPGQMVATPLVTVDAPKGVDETADVLVRLVAEHELVAVVVGYPRTLSGREGAAARRARELAEALADRAGIPVMLWDERFSTSEAERVMLAQDAKRRERRVSLDRVAASLILQGVMEARRGGATWR